MAPNLQSVCTSYPAVVLATLVCAQFGFAVAALTSESVLSSMHCFAVCGGAPSFLDETLSHRPARRFGKSSAAPGCVEVNTSVAATHKHQHGLISAPAICRSFGRCVGIAAQ
jgi:hypothetical protein